MGALASIGVLDNGKIADRSKTAFKDSTVTSIEQGFSIGSFQIVAGQIELGSFSNESGQNHVDMFPAWNGMYVTGLLQNIALTLDKIPDAGILKSIGIFDPTRPILIIITKLRSLFDRIFSFLPFSIDDLLLQNISIILGKIDDIVGALDSVIDELVSSGVDAARDAAEDFLSVLKDVISAVMRAASYTSSAIADVLQKISDEASSIKNAIVEMANEILTSINLPLPTLTIPSLDLSFMPSGVNLQPLFASVEANQYDGIATKFIKLMTAFASLPAKIVEFIQRGVDIGSKLKQAFQKLLTNISQGIQDMLDVLVDAVWNIITSVISIPSQAILEAASIFQIVLTFVKYFIVSLISFLMGSGLIALSAATLLGIA